jgi:Protein of unknown function (DUF2726)
MDLSDTTATMISIVVGAIVFIVAVRSLGMLPTFRKRHVRRVRPDLTDVGRQLHFVMTSSFEKRRLLSAAEFRVFSVIEKEIGSERNGYRVFAQTCLGEILSSSNADAFGSVNSKRVDILVVDRGGWPAVAIEYQGSGHYQGTAAARDAVKREALRRAGVPLVEITEADTDNQIRYRVRENLGWSLKAVASDISADPQLLRAKA